MQEGTPAFSLNGPVPDGSYSGSWSGYEVTLKVGDGERKLNTDIGVRGFNIPCVVTSVGGKIFVNSK